MNVFKQPSQIEPSGDWGADNAAGRTLAGAVINDARTTGSPCAVSFALRDLAKSGRWTGVEVGFAFAVAAAVLDSGRGAQSTDLPPNAAYEKGYDDGFSDGVGDAAPSLLEAAKRALFVLESPTMPSHVNGAGTVDDLRAAIAEAERKAAA